MSDNQNKINELQRKLDRLIQQQTTFGQELKAIQTEIKLLKRNEVYDSSKLVEKEEVKLESSVEEIVGISKEKEVIKETSISKSIESIKPKANEITEESGLKKSIEKNLIKIGVVLLVVGAIIGDVVGIIGGELSVIIGLLGIGLIVFGLIKRKSKSEEVSVKETKSKESVENPISTPKKKSDIEKFIGENLINKIGIGIIIIGVIIGAKYSIENDLISPLTRIIFGYLTGIGLLGFGIKLKEKYENYSAVLVSGAMMILYFITFSAYDFYALIPQMIAFGLMVLFTIFTVLAALNYNRKIIAILGLVGAYAVPFLLSNGSGQVEILFGYVTIINIGILFISFKKYWKSLFYTAFAFTWLIYGVWCVEEFMYHEQFELAFIVALINFVLFYATFIAYKLIKGEQFQKLDILLLLSNSFIFFGVGFALLSEHEKLDELLGIFTLANGIVHFIISILFYKRKVADRKLFFLVSGLVMVFITMAIPVQLDGNWVTLLWTLQAVLLLWIGRTKDVMTYEVIAYPLMVLAFGSLVQDWKSAYVSYFYYTEEAVIMTSIFNIQFLTSTIFVTAFAGINYLLWNKKYELPEFRFTALFNIFKIGAAILLLMTLYAMFFVEIDYYFSCLYYNSQVAEDIYDKNYDLMNFKEIWILIYTMFFVTILSWINIKKLKNELIAYINIGLNLFVILLFLSTGLLLLSELRDTYLAGGTEYFESGVFNIIIRYISFGFLAALVFTIYQYISQEFIKKNWRLAFTLFVHFIIVWVLSSELIHWMEMANSSQSYKLGLSILWGVYSLSLIAYGIWKNNKPLRLGAIGLFAITLIKLFFYDIAHLNTISKTIVFVSLGILLLIISFMYNKYKHLIEEKK